MLEFGQNTARHRRYVMIPSSRVHSPVPNKHRENTVDLFRQKRDKKTRDSLILQNLGLVQYLAKKFANRGIPLEDLFQVGTIGLINAVDRFEFRRGTNFSAYAIPTIVGEIKRHFRDLGWVIKVPREIQELHTKITYEVAKLIYQLGREPSIYEIASSLDVSIEDVVLAQQASSAFQPDSLDEVISSDNNDPQRIEDTQGAEDSLLINLVENADLRAAIESLTESDPRLRSIIVRWYFQDQSESEICGALQIGRTQVYRLKNRAQQRIRSLMNQGQLASA